MIKIDQDSVSWKKNFDIEVHSEILFFGSKTYGFPNYTEDCYEFYDRTSFFTKPKYFYPGDKNDVLNLGGDFFYHSMYGIDFS